MSASTKILDASAIGLSGLCMAHCLALPLAAAALPAAAAWADAHWMHPIALVVAAPLTLMALAKSKPQDWTRSGGLYLAVLGLMVLVAALLSVHAWERPLALTGSLLIVAGHLLNWRDRRSA